jgi:hypothetical protein
MQAAVLEPWDQARFERWWEFVNHHAQPAPE